MDKKSRLDKIRSATTAAVERYRLGLGAVGSAEPRLGAVYLFPAPPKLDLYWAIVAGPSDDGFLFAVPADGHPLAGLTDVVVADCPPLGSLVLRCGHGLWMHPAEFTCDRHVAMIETRHVAWASEKLAQIAAGELKGSASQWETEANPDYDEWMAEVESAVDALANALRTSEEELTASDFGSLIRPGTSDEAVAEAEAPYALAASSTGAMSDLYDELQRGQGPAAKRIDLVYPGELFLTLETEGVAVVYVREGGFAPPDVVQISGGEATRPAAWLHSPGGKTSRAVFAWRDGRVTLRVGAGAAAREVTIRK